MKRILKISLLIIIFLGFSFFSYQLGIFVGENQTLKLPPPSIVNPQNLQQLRREVDFSIFWEAWRRLERDFLEKEKIDYQKMVYGAIRGMVESLEDPYTTFFDPQKTEEFNLELRGKYEGVGMEVAIKNEKITVVSPLEGTPAQKAGLRPGDEILKIDETLTENLSLEEAVRLIRGPAGSEVTLLISRDSWPQPKKIILKRAIIKIPTLKLEFKKTKKEKIPIAYLKIYQFNKILSLEFKKAAKKILNSSAQKIILDLRNNPGGYLQVAQEIAGWLLKKGDLVVWQDFGKNKERKEYRTKGPGTLFDYPMVVLINQGTASGAEILAGALRDNRKILLLGEKSFGKGSVQEQIFLSDNSSLKITIAKWLTPKGLSLDKEGLVPDIEVEMTDDDWNQGRDPQLDKALEIIEKIK